MRGKTLPGRRASPVQQFSVFTANRLGRLHELIGLLSGNHVHVIALSVLDTTDTGILRLVVDDPERARYLLAKNGFPFLESDLLVVELDSAEQLSRLTSILLEAELNVHYLYSFIPHARGKSLLALSMEDNEVAEKVVRRNQFRVLKQSDISR